MAGRCECKICVDGREFHRIISQFPAIDKTWMEKYYDDVCNEGLDANVNECIINGTWPNADDIIKFQREKQEERRNGITKR